MFSLFYPFGQITVFHIGSDEHQDIDVAILTALLKGETLNFKSIWNPQLLLFSVYMMDYL